MSHLKVVSNGKSSQPEEPDELKTILAKIRCIHHLGTQENWTQMTHLIAPVYESIERNQIEVNNMIKRDDFLEANHALLQVHSLMEIAQEAFTDPESENIYNLLGVIDEKVVIVLGFFEKNEDCFKKED